MAPSLLARFDVPPCPTAAVRALSETLGVSDALAQVLVRRGLGDPAAAREWLESDVRHPPSAFAGIDEAVGLVLDHVRAGSRVVVHGDYDVDGVCSTAILVRALRLLGGDADHVLPHRESDGYGLSAATVDRLAAAGTRLLITTDCAITAVDEVAAARAAGMDVLVTDHHEPRADGVVPDAPIVHPRLCGHPAPDLCATAVAHALAAALLEAGGLDPLLADEDLDLVALATVADCVPLQGMNRALVRAGLRALAATTKPGLRALMRIAHVPPGRVDATAIGFRLAPRLNAAGRVARADAALELLLTRDESRADQVAEELDRLNADRRHTEQRILFDAERQVAELGEQPAYVLWGEDWHPGVIGIVASRIAERHGRPALLVAVREGEGTGSGRSIPAFDLLAGLDACAAHLRRHGGHRAAAGCTVALADLPALRAAFCAHAAAVLRPEDLVPVARVDAIVSGADLGLELAEELERLAPFGIGNPEPRLLVPAARLTDARPMGEGKHLRFTVETGGVRAGAVAFGTASLPDGHDTALDATFALEVNEWQGAVEPRLVLKHACSPRRATLTVLDRTGPDTDWPAAVLAAFHDAARLQPYAAPDTGAAGRRRIEGPAPGGATGRIAVLAASGERTVVACADAAARRRHLDGRLAHLELVSHHALEHDPALLHDAHHVVLLDPPAHPALLAVLEAGEPDRTAHRLWGDAELRFAVDVHEHLHDLLDPLRAVYRSLRGGADLAAALAGPGDRPRHPVLAGRLLRVLEEADLAALDLAAFTARLHDVQRVDVHRSACLRACAERRREAFSWLTPTSSRAAA